MLVELWYHAGARTCPAGVSAISGLPPTRRRRSSPTDRTPAHTKQTTSHQARTAAPPRSQHGISQSALTGGLYPAGRESLGRGGERHLSRPSASSFAWVWGSGGRRGRSPGRAERVHRQSLDAVRSPAVARISQAKEDVELGSCDPAERCRGTIAEGAVWAEGVVVLAPHFDDYLGFFQRVEDLAVQAFVAQLPVKRFTVSVLPRAARFDEQWLCTHRLQPLLYPAGGHLRPAVGTYVFRNS